MGFTLGIEIITKLIIIRPVLKPMVIGMIGKIQR